MNPTATIPSISYRYAQPIIDHHVTQFDDVSGRKSLRECRTHRIEQACEYLAKKFNKRCEDLTPTQLTQGIPEAAEKFNVKIESLARILKAK